MIDKRMKKHRIVAFILLATMIFIVVVMSGCNKVQPLVIDNPMILYELKPESYEIVLDENGQIAGYILKEG